MYHWTHVYDWYIQLYLCGDEKKKLYFFIKECRTIVEIIQIFQYEKQKIYTHKELV